MSFRELVLDEAVTASGEIGWVNKCASDVALFLCWAAKLGVEITNNDQLGVIGISPDRIFLVSRELESMGAYSTMMNKQRCFIRLPFTRTEQSNPTAYTKD